jgi:hypothetical protein
VPLLTLPPPSAGNSESEDLALVGGEFRAAHTAGSGSAPAEVPAGQSGHAGRHTRIQSAAGEFRYAGRRRAAMGEATRCQFAGREAVVLKTPLKWRSRCPTARCRRASAAGPVRRGGRRSRRSLSIRRCSSSAAAW